MLLDEEGGEKDQNHEDEGIPSGSLMGTEELGLAHSPMHADGIIDMNAGQDIGRCICHVEESNQSGEDIVSWHYRGSDRNGVGPDVGSDNEEGHADGKIQS